MNQMPDNLSILSPFLHRWRRKCNKDLTGSSVWTLRRPNNCERCMAPTKAGVKKCSQCNRLGKSFRGRIRAPNLPPLDPILDDIMDDNEWLASIDAGPPPTPFVVPNRSKLTKFKHYWTRFTEQQHFLEKETNELALFKTISLAEMEMWWDCKQLLYNSLTTLCKCRLTLIYCLPFLYYIEANNQSIILAENMLDLEKSVLKLFGLKSKIFPNLVTLDSLKAQIIDTTVYCKSREKVICDHVIEGFAEDSYWKFKDLF